MIGFLNMCRNVSAKPSMNGAVMRDRSAGLGSVSVLRRPGGRAVELDACRNPSSSSAEQFLLTTLVVKLAVMAALATMLARYRRFRHILIFERRGWPDRLVFALA